MQKLMRQLDQEFGQGQYKPRNNNNKNNRNNRNNNNNYRNRNYDRNQRYQQKYKSGDGGLDRNDFKKEEKLQQIKKQLTVNQLHDIVHKLQNEIGTLRSAFQTRVVKKQEFGKTIKAIKDLQEKHLSIDDVRKMIDKGDSEIQPVYRKMIEFAKTGKMKKKMLQMLGQKAIKQGSQKQSLKGRTQQQIMSILLLDDFWDDLKGFGSKVYSSIKQVYNKNAPKIHDMLATGLSAIFPQAAPLIGTARNALRPFIGGPMKSQHPLAVDKKYMQFLFGGTQPTPAPRKQQHYMYQMNATIEVPVTVLSDGTATIVIQPYSAPYRAVLNGPGFPFVNVAGTAGNFPMSTNTYSMDGPFYSQYGNIINYAIDSVQINYINTQPALNVQGKFISSIFYQSPNATFNRNITTGVYNFGAVQITDPQLLQNTGFFRRFTNSTCNRLTSVGRFIPQESFQKCTPLVVGVDSQLYTSGLPWIILKFTGCNASRVIGSVFIRVSISVQPTAAVRQILKVQPRGSYEGVYRSLKQARKMGVPLQFISYQQALPFFIDNYQQLDIKQLRSVNQIGQGQYIPLPGFQKIQQSEQGIGLCLKHSLQAIGVPNSLQSYSTVNAALSYSRKIFQLYYQNRQIVMYSQFDLKLPFVYVNVSQRHAVAVVVKDVRQLARFIYKQKFIIVVVNGVKMPYQCTDHILNMQGQKPLYQCQQFKQLQQQQKIFMPAFQQQDYYQQPQTPVRHKNDLQKTLQRNMVWHQLKQKTALKNPLSQTAVKRKLQKQGIQPNPGPVSQLMHKQLFDKPIFSEQILYAYYVTRQQNGQFEHSYQDAAIFISPFFQVMFVHDQKGQVQYYENAHHALFAYIDICQKLGMKKAPSDHYLQIMYGIFGLDIKTSLFTYDQGTLNHRKRKHKLWYSGTFQSHIKDMMTTIQQWVEQDQHFRSMKPSQLLLQQGVQPNPGPVTQRIRRYLQRIYTVKLILAAYGIQPQSSKDSTATGQDQDQPPDA